MRPARLAHAALAAALLAGSPAAGQDRPSEEELFGAPPAEERGDVAGEPEAAPERDVEAELFGTTGSPAALPPPPEGVLSRQEDDPLRIGGQLYLRAGASWRDAVAPGDWPLAAPSLLDLYLDARPSGRVRAFALARSTYDATLEGEARDGTGAEDPGLPGTLGGAPAQNPDVVLDQLWVNFDVARRAFVTAGKQHVKWGVGRFWNPTDYLHAVRRDPLAPFDVRTGTTLVKVHVPWEARGWNAYGVLALEDTGAGTAPTRRLGAVGTGGRVEAVVGTLEVGLDALVRDGRKPRFGVDASLGVWELDLYAEAALRSGGDVPRWRLAPDGATLERVRHEGLTPQIVAGGTWSTMYSDEDVLTLGAEYFFDDTGYASAEVYPFLLAVPFVFPGEPLPFSPFYLGRHQAAVFAVLPAPGAWNDTTLTASALANLSDRSLIVRLDHSLLALSYLRVETYVAGHLGRRGGVYRFAVDPALLAAVPPDLRAALGPIDRAPVLDVGVALRVDL